MLDLILLVCLAIVLAPMFSKGWLSYSLLAFGPALFLIWLWYFDMRDAIHSPDADAGTAVAGGLYFVVCVLFACTASGRLISLSLSEFAGRSRKKALVWELLPLMLLASALLMIAGIILLGG